MAKSESPKSTHEEILAMLSALKTGDFSKRLGATNDPNLQSMIDSLNETAQALESQNLAARDVSFIVDSLGIGIWKWDVTTNALEWDRNMYKLYGASPDEFNGAYDAWERSLSAETKAKAVEEINQAVRGEKEFDTTFQVVHKSGKIQEIRTRAFVIRDKDGKALKMWGINVDRSREVELEKAMQIERVKALQSAKLASLGEMSAGIAHEINNPLAVIVGSASLLTKVMGNPEKLVTLAEAIQKAGGRITKIVRGLKKFSHHSEGDAYQKHLLSEIVQESLTLIEPKSKLHSTSMTFECKSESPILGDEVEIEQVVINLVNNAIDAAKGSAERWVKVEISDEPKWVELRVIDSGADIDEKVRNKIFEPFFTTKKVGEGTGLGLSITKGILDEHKATIELSINSQNTCFLVRFPKATNEPASPS